MAALGRYVGWQLRSRLQQEIEVSWIEGAKLVVRRGMTGAAGNLYCGLHECADMAFLLHLLRPGDLFVDVGANVGSYTVLASAVCGARSIAIEPDPLTAQALRRNVEANRMVDRVTVVEAAVGADEGTVSFTTGHDTTNHVARSGEAGTREVPLRTLDRLLAGEDPLLIKIDVEGYEPSVFAGARRVIEGDRLAAVIAETVDAAMRSQLAQAGFVEVRYEPFQRKIVSGRAGPAAAEGNRLFVRENLIRGRLEAAPHRRIAGVAV
ncbi:FkbM family methyltransferase [Prosthecomicrobium pneumaticum]|uniref:FkbM family methyltransferase n=1 Tax=Prosthecomicrobium pneumaticum TaxID=81895 RepID=A0A7W9CUL0_9HYPH|nr:FkbM family methyltransferase [Prosthecomicrobium pneumaticum]